MEQNQFEKIQKWFEKLDVKVDRVEDQMATKQQLENRFQMLFTALTNLHKKVEDYKGQQNEEITVLRLALNDLQRQVKDLHQRFHS